MKRHDPSLDNASTRPCETLVRRLLCDLRIPLGVLARDLCFPMKPFCIQLCDFFYTFHKLREFFKVHPLSIGLVLRHIDFNGFLNDLHTVLRYMGFSETARIDL